MRNKATRQKWNFYFISFISVHGYRFNHVGMKFIGVLERDKDGNCGKAMDDEVKKDFQRFPCNLT
jgi:hypothetical protein